MHPDATPEDVSGTRFFDALHWPEAGPAAIDLLQGRFEPSARRVDRKRARLQWLAAACLPPLLVALSSSALGLWHARQAEVIRGEARALLEKSHPEVAGIPSISMALRAASPQTEAPDEPPVSRIGSVFGPFGTAFGRIEAQSRPRITGLRYQHSRGYLDVLLDARDVPELEALRAALDEAGTPARLVSASRVGERFDGRLRVGHETP